MRRQARTKTDYQTFSGVVRTHLCTRVFSLFSSLLSLLGPTVATGDWDRFCDPVRVKSRRLVFFQDEGQGHLLDKLSKTVGFGMGLEFRESANTLSATNSNPVRAGMVFNVSLGAPAARTCASRLCCRQRATTSHPRGMKCVPSQSKCKRLICSARVL